MVEILIWSIKVSLKWVSLKNSNNFTNSECHRRTEFFSLFQITPPTEIIWVKNVRAIVLGGFLFNEMIKMIKKYFLKIKKKIAGAVWELPTKLNSTTNPANFHSIFKKNFRIWNHDCPHIFDPYNFWYRRCEIFLTWLIS